jgi:hypothetical protein
MRSVLRVALLLFILLVLLAPLTTYASGGPCPDDPVGSKNCAYQAPPFYVVINRDFSRLGPDYGTGCQPWILENPDCDDCDDVNNAACTQAAADVEQIICADQMPIAGGMEGDTLFEMCCNCTSGANGTWMYRTRTLHYNPQIQAWECPNPGPWQPGLPPRTGIDLPMPLVVGGLAVAGVALAGTGLALRRRPARLG